MALAVVALPGCPNPTGSIAFEQLPAQLASAQCAQATRCGTGLDTYESFVLREQITDCPAQLAAFITASGLGPIQAGIDDGSIIYHPDIAGACVASYADAGCGPGSQISEACFDVFEGTLADGAPCSNAEQCGATSTCDSSRTGMCPSGVCVHVPQLGEACESSCAFGLRCASGTCARPLASGAACNPLTSGECGDGLDCVAPETDPTHGTCSALEPAGVGEPCGRAGCEAGLLCSPSTGTCRQPRTDGTCEAVFYGLDDCDSGEQCIVETGTAAGTCEPLPTTGEPCTSICARGSRCVGTPGGSGTCTVPVANGGACETSGECLSGYCSSGVCAVPPICRPS